MILGVLILLIAILTLGTGIYILIMGVKEREWFIAFVGLILILFVILPTGYAIYDSIEKSKCTSEIQIVDAMVEEKEYKAPYTTYIYSGKVMTPIVHSEQYNITLRFQDTKTDIDNKELFEALNKGDKIQTKLTIYRRKNSKVYKKELSIDKFN